MPEPVYALADGGFWYPLPAGWTGGPCAPGPTPVVHTWFTSSFTGPQSIYYYCDDDPAFAKNVEAKDRVSFPTVAALLTAYPGRTLHQPCDDGTIGP